MEFPFAGFFGLNFARNSAVQTGDQLLDHPLPALLEALEDITRLGAVSTESRDVVVQFTSAGATSPAWIGIDPRDASSGVLALDRRPSQSRRGDLHGVVHRLYAGRRGAAADGPDEQDGLARSGQPDVPGRFLSGQRCRADQLPARSPSRRRPRRQVPRKPRQPNSPTACGTCVWAPRAAPVIEFDKRLVMFEAYGGEAQTLARDRRREQARPRQDRSRR